MLDERGKARYPQGVILRICEVGLGPGRVRDIASLPDGSFEIEEVKHFTGASGYLYTPKEDETYLCMGCRCRRRLHSRLDGRGILQDRLLLLHRNRKDGKATSLLTCTLTKQAEGFKQYEEDPEAHRLLARCVLDRGSVHGVHVTNKARTALRTYFPPGCSDRRMDFDWVSPCDETWVRFIEHCGGKERLKERLREVSLLSCVSQQPMTHQTKVTSTPKASIESFGHCTAPTKASSCTIQLASLSILTIKVMELALPCMSTLRV